MNSLTLERELTATRTYLAAGFVSLFAVLGGVGVWSVTADLAGAVIAPGSVAVASNFKKIQHPAGGVVGAILVRNGDHVKAGDVVMRLDETVMRANLQVIVKHLDQLLGQQARLIAERDDSPAITFPDSLVSRRSDLAVTDIMAGEQKLFEEQMSTRRSEDAQLRQRISGIGEEIAGATAQAAAKSQEIELINSELASLASLEAKQLVTTSRLSALRREAARLEGEHAALLASIGQGKQRIAEIEVQRLTAESQFRSSILKDIREAAGGIGEFSERRSAAEDQLQRVELTSPVSGIVDQLAVFTVGGVISPGETVMTIMPDGDERVVEAKIRPQDIADATIGGSVTIRLTAFDLRTTPTIKGQLVNLSTDLLHDPQTSTSYFKARIEIPELEMEKVPGRRLIAGMPAEVQIGTGSRTALSYLLKPLSDQFARAFKER